MISSPRYFTNFFDQVPNASGMRMLIHLPQIRIEEDVHSTKTSIVRLDLEKWKLLEGGSARDWDDYYGAQQTFISSKVYNIRDWDNQVQEFRSQFKLHSLSVWSVILTTFGIALPSPKLSTSYIAFVDDDDNLVGCMRERGSSGLQLLARPFNRLFISKRLTPYLAYNLELIDDLYRTGYGSVYRLLLSPFEGVRGSDFINENFVNFVTAIEMFTNPEATLPLRRTFCDRWAHILSHEAFESERSQLDACFRFRSAFLHGDTKAVCKISDREPWARSSFPHDILSLMFGLVHSLKSVDTSHQWDGTLASADLLLRKNWSGDDYRELLPLARFDMSNLLDARANDEPGETKVIGREKYVSMRPPNWTKFDIQSAF